ncbi:hypothetical protein ES705_48307 [subsurface metagenome]
MFPQEHKSIEELEETRKLYMTLFDIAKRNKLEDYEQFFLDKIEQSTEHRRLTEKYAEKEIKTKMIIFWQGLLDEVRRRL